MTLDNDDSALSHDFLIIGAGPGGLQLAYYLEKAGEDYLILEASHGPATFFKTFPRHRTLISNNKVYTGYDDPEVNLRWDWNSLLSEDNGLLMQHYSQEYFPKADDLVTYLSDYAARYKLRIKYNTKAVKIRKDTVFRVIDEDGCVYTSPVLIVATGVSRRYVPDIPGVDLAEWYTDVSVDAKEFVNQRVLIVGKGNSGFETASNLLATAAVIHIVSPNPIQMAWKTHYVGHLRAVNNDFLDTYQLKSQNAVLDAVVERIERKNGQFAVMVSYAHAEGEKEELLYDRVIVCTGFRFDSSIFDESCKLALAIKNRFPEQTSEWESTNVPSLYFAGTLTQTRDFKKSNSGFIHGFRYNARILHNILLRKYGGKEWPHFRVSQSPEALTQAVIKRINGTSALWQQFGFICDLIVIEPSGGQASYYEELPFSYVRDSDFGAQNDYYTITLEYGPESRFIDPFHVPRIARDQAERAEDSNFLHPIVRRFNGQRMVAEHHIIEDLAAEWLEEVHTLPLLHFFELQTANNAAPSVVKATVVQ